MRTPVVVVTGVDTRAQDAVMVGLAWDVPDAVSVRHRIDPESQVLSRVVSDATGVLETAEVPLAHACVSCALREDVLPTLERLAGLGRWRTIVACLPGGAEADQLSTLLTRDARLARRLTLASLVAALGTDHLVDDLLSDDLLVERGWHMRPDDDRGVGEVACAQVEIADAAVLVGGADETSRHLVEALVRPGAEVVDDAVHLDGVRLTGGRHQHQRAVDWVHLHHDRPLAHLGDTTAWRLDLSSVRPFHPERLVEHIELLGTGRHRSRGCFWLPTRPGVAQEWSGAGGQLSIGRHGGWNARTPQTRLVFTGVGTAPTHLVESFERLLVTPEEGLLGPDPQHGEDGLEPWLGEIRDVA